MKLNLLKYRKMSNISQQELARLLKIPQTTYSSYETNKVEPDNQTLIDLAKIFNVSVDELLGVEKPKINKNFNEEETRILLNNLSKLNRENLIKVDAHIKTYLELQNNNK